MKISKTRAAIIQGVLVPATEVDVLRALVLLGRPATVPELARSTGDAISHATFYSLLGRLAGQRGLVSREEKTVEVAGQHFKRVFWSPHQAAARYFDAEAERLHHDVAGDQTAQPAPGMVVAGI